MAIPVILDTDIGSDIDDTWALAFMLRCPELDVRLVVTDRGHPEYRARLACRILEAANRSDIPVALGTEWEGNTGATWQRPCVEGYNLSSYEGEILQDGPEAIADVVTTSEEPVTVVAIGPMPTLANALARSPDISSNARFIGMHGSLRLGHKRDRDTVVAEANVVNDPTACADVFAAPWDLTITPIDSCGIVQLEGATYERVLRSKDPLARAVIENYSVWSFRGGSGPSHEFHEESSILFDTVAVYLAYSEDLLEMETLNIRVTEDGFTRIDDEGKKINCATGWKPEGLERMHELVSERIAGIP